MILSLNNLKNLLPLKKSYLLYFTRIYYSILKNYYFMPKKSSKFFSFLLNHVSYKLNNILFFYDDLI